MLTFEEIVKYHGIPEDFLIKIMKIINSLRPVCEGEKILRIFNMKIN